MPKTACFSIIYRDVVKLLSRIETFLSTNTFKIALEQEKEGRIAYYSLCFEDEAQSKYR